MITELATSSAPVVVIKGDEIEVSAATPNEMARSQDALIAWARAKVALTAADADELGQSFEEAKKHKWKSTTLLRHFRLALGRVEFYKKILGALEAGYIIVPTFPVDVFAIRTDKGTPRGIYVSSYSYGENPNLRSLEEEPKGIPSGEGEYKNPFPLVWHSRFTPEGKSEQHQYTAHDWKDIEFPINMSKPNIMQATDRAMMLKIFDDFGILPNASKKVDPIIVGRIKAPKKYGYQEARLITFLIGWHLDTNTL